MNQRTLAVLAATLIALMLLAVGAVVNRLNQAAALSRPVATVATDNSAPHSLSVGAKGPGGTGLPQAHSGPVDVEQAARAAQAYRRGGDVREVELEHERGGMIYQVTFTDGTKVYVEAATGQVVYALLDDHSHGD